MIHYITSQEAKKMMDADQNAVILDVREADEYEEGHIPSSVLLPLGEVKRQIAHRYEDKTTCFLVYCRSGRRSKEAALIMDSLGYEKIFEFGGILDWPFDIER